MTSPGTSYLQKGMSILAMLASLGTILLMGHIMKYWLKILASMKY